MLCVARGEHVGEARAVGGAAAVARVEDDLGGDVVGGAAEGVGAAAAGQASALTGSPRVPLLAGEAEEEAAQALLLGEARDPEGGGGDSDGGSGGDSDPLNVRSGAQR